MKIQIFSNYLFTFSQLISNSILILFCTTVEKIIKLHLFYLLLNTNIYKGLPFRNYPWEWSNKPIHTVLYIHPGQLIVFGIPQNGLIRVFKELLSIVLSSLYIQSITHSVPHLQLT